MAKRLKIGVVGLGGIWTWAHCEPMMAHEEVEVVGVCDIIKAKADKFAKAHKIANSFKNYRDLLKVKGLDALDICTPNLFHSEIAIAALEAGLHVFCEKPDAVNPDEARKMRDAAKASGKTLMVMRNNRFNPNAQFLKKYIADGQMGDIYAGRCGWIRRRGTPGRGGWFTTKALSGGGPLIDLGVHFIDLSMWLMGNPKPVAVSGMTYRKFDKAPEGSDSVHSQFGQQVTGGTFDVEDLAMGMIRFDNGATLQIEFSWASNVDSEVNFCELRGDKGGCTLNGERDLKIFTEINGTLCDILPRFAKGPMTTHGMMLCHFVDVVRGRAKPIMTPEQGLDMIKILAAIYSSAESGREVRLD
jgi:predicted dehydrogenase